MKIATACSRRVAFRYARFLPQCGMFARCCCLLLLTSARVATAANEPWHFDPVHSQIVFAVDHLGFAHAQGLLTIARSSVEFDRGDWSTAKIDVEVDIESLAMGNAKWQDTVKSWQFLRAKRWPTARFVSRGVERRDEHRGVVHGDLRMHGASRPLDVEFTLNKIGRDPYTFKDTAGFSARVTLQRSDFGMDKLLSAVGNDVELRIEAELQHGAAFATTAPAPTESPTSKEDEDGPAQ